MPSQGTQCTHFPLVHPSASVLLPELSCFWQLASITRSSCAGRSYFPDSMKLLFLAEEKQLLSRETKLARLGSAVLWLLFLRCFHALWWLSHAGSHGKDHSSTQWREAQHFVLSYIFTVFNSRHSSQIISVQGVGVCSKLLFSDKTKVPFLPLLKWRQCIS